MPNVTIPQVKVEKGKQYEVAVSISGLPKGITAFDCTIKTEPMLCEIDAVARAGMTQKTMLYFNNSPIVHNPISEDGSSGGETNKNWLSPWNRGCVYVNAAQTTPFSGRVMFHLKLWAAATGTAIITCTYLVLGNQTIFGMKPPMMHLVDGLWVPYEG